MLDRIRWRRGARLSLAGVASAALVAGLAVVASTAYADQADRLGTAAPVVEPQLLDELSAGGTAEFWVYLREQADLSPAAAITDWAEQGQFVYEELTTTAAASQADLLTLLDAAGADYHPFWISNTVQVSGDAALLDSILELPEVEQVAADRTYGLVEPEDGSPEGIASVEWNIDRINAPEVWEEFGIRGAGTVIGVIDTGVLHTHDALVEQYRGNRGGGVFDHHYNWHDPSQICGSPSLVPCDNHGHGSHVTGIAVGDDGGSNQIGVAPEAQWIAAKGCESTSCSQFALLSSGQFMLAPTDLSGADPRPQLRPHVVNNSWGGPPSTDPWYQPTVRAWTAAGMFPQFAAGNLGPACGTASNPGNLPESYAAGSFDINGNIAVSSSRGPSAFGVVKPDIAAPGVNIRSAWNNGGYVTIGGTSMASPHVAGTVALMWSASVGLERDVRATRAILNQTAISVSDLSCGGTPDRNNVWGNGKLDALAAVRDAVNVPAGGLRGEVTDAVTGLPIAGATITITGQVDRQLTTGSAGTYRVRLPGDDYQVTASASGYVSQSVVVTVVPTQLTVQDFALVRLVATPSPGPTAIPTATPSPSPIPTGTASPTP